MLNKIKETLGYLTEALKKPEQTRFSFGYSDITFFLQFLRPEWKLFSISLLLTVIMTGLGSLLPLVSKFLIDFVVMKKGFERLEVFLISIGLANYIQYARQLFESMNFLLLAMLIIGIMVGLIGLIQRYLIFRLEQELTFNLQSALFDHILRFPLSFFKKSQVGYLSSRVSDDVNMLHIIFVQTISQIIPGIFRLFFGIGIIFFLSIKLSFILIGILPLYIFINYYFAGRLRSATLDELENSSFVSRDIQEVISGIETVKAYSAEKKETQRVLGKMRSLIQTRIKRIIITLFSDYSARGSQFIVTLLIMWFGVQEILKEAITIGDYVAFTAYVIYLSSSLNSLAVFHISLQPVFASLGRLLEIFRIIPELKKPELKRTEAYTKPEKTEGKIIFRDITFSYEERNPLLKNITFTAFPGEILALVGPSGAGKTTLVNLLLKFYTPQSGSISIDGYDFKEINTSWLREQIGIVSQDVFLFNDTVENNIKYGNPLATREEVIDAAKKAGIHDDIENFPDKYDTYSGERGVKLSAGQRQRISIARALLKNPPILIFDEPTSALDSETETILKDSIKRLSSNKTIFIIAHRLSTIDIADRILVLENGEIAESGKHEELTQKRGLYNRLFREERSPS